MRIEKIMAAVIGLLVCALAFTYVLFKRGGTSWEAAAEPEQRTEILVLSSYDTKQEQELLRRLAEDFNAVSQSLAVRIEFTESENLKKDIFLRVDDGGQPDILICSGMDMPGLADMGILEELTEKIDGRMRRSVIYQDLWQSTMSDGRYYGLPFTCNPYVMFYNKTYLEEHNLPIPSNWDQVFDVCNGIEGSGIYGLGMGLRRCQDAAILFNSILYVCGGNYYSLDAVQGLRTLEIFETLNRWGCMDKYAINSTPKDAAKSFVQGRSVMLLAPLDMQSELERQSPGFAYGIGPLPGEIKEGYVLSGDNICLLEEADPEAEEFLKYLYEPEIREQIIRQTNTLPVFQEEFRNFQAGEDIRRLNEGFSSQGVVLQSYNAWFEISEIIQERLGELLTLRNTDIQTMAKTLQDQIRVAMMNN